MTEGARVMTEGVTVMTVGMRAMADGVTVMTEGMRAMTGIVETGTEERWRRSIIQSASPSRSAMPYSAASFFSTPQVASSIGMPFLRRSCSLLNSISPG